MTRTDNIARIGPYSLRSFGRSLAIVIETPASVLRGPATESLPSPEGVAWILDMAAVRDGLGRWQDCDGLHEIVLKSIWQVNPKALVPVAPPAAGVAFESRTLLALLTWCYASRIYGSEEIEELMRADRAFRLRCENEYPQWRTLRRFRRYNAPWIEQCLAEVLTRQATRDPDASSAASSPAVGAMSFRSEATRRIEIARFIDHMTDDD